VQFYLNYSNAVRKSALIKHCSKAHYETVKIDNGAGAYCMKEDTRLEGPWEYGIKPVKRNDKADWEEVWTKAKAGKLEDIPAEIRVRHYG
jgi:hypothetical protein